MKKYLFLFLMLFVAGWMQAQERVVYSVNDGWKFMKGSPFEAHLAACDDSSWETVHIPHTWNAKDTDDDEPGYYRGPAWYRKNIFIDRSQEGRNVVMYFEPHRIRRGYYECYIRLITDDINSWPQYAISDEYARRLESQICDDPAAWLWTHNRWKNKVTMSTTAKEEKE